VWVAQWSELGGKRSKVLGRFADLSKSQAETMLAQILQPINEKAGHHAPAIYTFGQYVSTAFLPACRNKWKESTRSTSEADIMRYLVPAFDTTLLNAISREQMQGFLNQMAEKLSESVVAHLRWHLNAIFKMAQSDGAVPFNHAAALFNPPCKPEPVKRVLTKEDVRQALSILDVRERLVFRMAVFNGMRPGEIFAVQLGKLSSNSLVVDQRIYGSHLDTPKGRKGRRTERLVALSPGTVRDLGLWRKFLGDGSEGAFLFPSETGQTPLRPNNHWKREMRPRLEKVGLGWVNFQVLRRTHASLSRKAKVDDKVSADQRGHGLGVSLSVYAISDLEQKIDAVTKLESDVFTDSELI
jgi:integrase